MGITVIECSVHNFMHCMHFNIFTQHDAYDEHRKKHPDNYSWKVHFGPWRAGYMDVTINNFVMRYGMYDIEEESKKNRKYFDKNSNYSRGIYESNSVEF